MAAVGRKYQLGWWPQGGVLDAIDTALSLPVLTLRLGKLEYFIAVPGTWFGMPPMAWGVMPLFVGAYAAADEADSGALRAWLAYVCLPLLALSLAGFFYMLRSGSVLVVFTATKHLIIPCAVLPALGSEQALGPRAKHAVALVLCAWLCTESVCHLAKISARRMRPPVALPAQLRAASREFPALQAIVSKGETAFQSFPSGDAAGAAVYSCVLVLYGAGVWAWLPVALSAFGRVYLQAHHVLDVTAGALIGCGTTWLLWRRCGLGDAAGPVALGAAHVCVAMGAFIALHVACRKHLSFEIPAEFRTGTGIYGREYTGALDEAADAATPSVPADALPADAARHSGASEPQAEPKSMTKPKAKHA